MKKIILAFVLSLMFVPSLYSQCNLPDGVTDTPAWTECLQPITIQISETCFLVQDFCFRITEDGECEILLGWHGVGSYDFDTQTHSSCYWDTWDPMREIYTDKVIQEISLNGIAQCVSTSDVTTDCDDATANPPTSLRVIQSDCQTEALWDTYEEKYIARPCEGGGYCVYEYTYCLMTIDEGLPTEREVITYDRKAIEHHNVACASQLLVGSNYHDCYPVLDGEGCYEDRIGIGEIDINDIHDYQTCDELYIDLQVRATPIFP